MRTFVRALVLASTSLLTLSAHPHPPIEIKGIRLGMSTAEAKLLPGYPMFQGFTIAAVESKFKRQPIKLEFHEGKVARAIFFFDPSGFDQVKAAFLAKYPHLRCTTSRLQNTFGATVQQEECGDSTLAIRRYASLDTAAVYLTNGELERKEAADVAAKAKTDL